MFGFLEEHWEFVIQLAVFVGGAVGLWYRINGRVDLLQKSAIERDERATNDRAQIVRRLEEIEVEIQRMDDQKMPRSECHAVHGVLSSVLDSLRAEIRALNGHVVDLASVIRRNGGH